MTMDLIGGGAGDARHGTMNVWRGVLGSPYLNGRVLQLSNVGQKVHILACLGTIILTGIFVPLCVLEKRSSGDSVTHIPFTVTN